MILYASIRNHIVQRTQCGRVDTSKQLQYYTASSTL